MRRRRRKPSPRAWKAELQLWHEDLDHRSAPRGPIDSPALEGQTPQLEAFGNFRSMTLPKLGAESGVRVNRVTVSRLYGFHPNLGGGDALPASPGSSLLLRPDDLIVVNGESFSFGATQDSKRAECSDPCPPGELPLLLAGRVHSAGVDIEICPPWSHTWTWGTVHHGHARFYGGHTGTGPRASHNLPLGQP